MKFCKLVGFSLVALLLLPLPSHAVEIAYVDARRLIEEAPQGRDEVEKLEAEFSERGRELQAKIDLFTTHEKDLQKNAVTMSSEELEERTNELLDMQRALQREQQVYNEDYTRSRNQGLARLEQLISIVIIDVAKREKIDLVLQQAVYASRDIDLTGKVLEELDRRYRQ